MKIQCEEENGNCLNLAMCDDAILLDAVINGQISRIYLDYAKVAQLISALTEWRETGELPE